MSLSSIIGQASRGADLYFVFRFLRLLTMDYKKTDAYKFKIIDSKGNALRKSADLESIKEKAAYTMLHRMVFKIRRLIEKVPGGRFISYAAALFLLKEQKDVRIWTDDGYMKTKLLEFLETDWEADAKFLKEEVDNMEKKSFTSFLSESKDLAESQELQAMMALDDAGIEAVIDKKGKIVVNKRDLKKAEKALKKSFRKGGEPDLIGEEMDPRDHVEEKDGKFVVVAPSGKIVYTSDDKKEAEEWAIKNHDDLMKEEVELTEEFKEKDFDALKKGDTITIEFKSSMSTGKSTFRVTAKNIVGKAKVHKATLQNVKNPRSVKFFLYKRGNKVSLAQGDMAASVVKYTIEQLEERKMTDGEKEEREEIVKKLKPKLQSFKDRYGDDAKKVMYATATKQAMEEVELEEMPNRRNMEKINSLLKKYSGQFKWRDEVLYVEKGIEKDVTSLIKKGGLTATVKVSSNPLQEKKSATGYELYHKTFSDAMQHAYAHAKSKGFIVDPKEIDDKVATGPKKPSSGKTNRYSLKAGRKTVEIQVANLDNKRYELNMYIEGVELEEALSRKDQLRLALAKSKFKKSGGKVEVQPPSPAIGSKKYRGMYMAAPKTKEDEKMAQDVLDYRKKMKMKKQLKRKVWYKKEEVELEEAFSMGKGDKRVVDAFYDQKEIKAHGASILTTDGKTLTKRGMGGQDIAKWVSGKIKIVAVSDVKSTELILKYMKKSIPSGVFEEMGNVAPTAPDSGGIQYQAPVLGQKKKKKKQTIDEAVKRTTFAGKDVFIVDSETYYNCRLGKKKYGRYEKYVGDGKVGQTIREYGLKYPRRPIILQNGESGPMLYLKYGRS